jgi:hypothetical protein
MTTPNATSPDGSDGLVERLRLLEREVARLRADVAPADATRETAEAVHHPSEEPRTRRELLLAGLAATAGAAGATLLAAAPAGATTGAMQYGANNDAGSDTTGLTSTASATFQAANTGGGAQLYLVPGSQVGPPAGTRSRGQIAVDTTGALFTCVETGPPSVWVRQAPLELLPAPVRVYDSRPGPPVPALIGGDGPLTPGTERTVKIAGLGAIPAAIHAVLANLTVTETVGAGFLSVFDASVDFPGTSNINWSGNGFDIANSVTSSVSWPFGGQVRVHCGGGLGASTQFIVDVIGYYR